MYVIYGLSLVLWLMLMDVGAERSWETFDISKGKQLARLLLRIAIAVVITWVLVTFLGSYQGVANWNGLIFAPFATVFYYIVYILFNLKHRETWREYLRADRWNAVALLGCVIASTVASVMK